LNAQGLNVFSASSGTGWIHSRQNRRRWTPEISGLR
jgi:hypothetical protein